MKNRIETINGRFKKRAFVYSCISLTVLLCSLPANSAVVRKSGSVQFGIVSDGPSSSVLHRLMNEKTRKMAQLEQCAKKVNGFKIAGISTLGLTAVGVAGNVALANKKKGLQKEIQDTQKKIETEQKKKADIEAKIEKHRQAKRISESECANITGATWKNDKCVCDDENKTIKNGLCTDGDVPGLLSGGYGADYDFKADCLAHSEIATWKELEPDDDGTERGECLCNDSSKVFENSKCISKIVAQRRCLDTGGWWEDDFCVCGDYEEEYEIPTAELSGYIDETSLECKLNRAFVNKYKIKQDSSGRWWPAEYIDGKCLRVDDGVYCTAVDESVWLDEDADENTMIDYFDMVLDDVGYYYLPENICYKISREEGAEIICSRNGRVVKNGCSSGGATYIEDGDFCGKCPNDGVFFDAMCRSQDEAKKRCEASGGTIDIDEYNGVKYADCDNCDHTNLWNKDVSCMTEEEYKKKSPLLP